MRIPQWVFFDSTQIKRRVVVYRQSIDIHFDFALGSLITVIFKPFGYSAGLGRYTFTLPFECRPWRDCVELTCFNCLLCN